MPKAGLTGYENFFSLQGSVLRRRKVPFRAFFRRFASQKCPSGWRADFSIPGRLATRFSSHLIPAFGQSRPSTATPAHFA